MKKHTPRHETIEKAGKIIAENMYLPALAGIKRELAAGKTIEEALSWHPAATQTLASLMSRQDWLRECRYAGVDRRVKLVTTVVESYAKDWIKVGLARHDLYGALKAVRAYQDAKRQAAS